MQKFHLSFEILHAVRETWCFCGVTANFFQHCFLSEIKILMAFFNVWICFGNHFFKGTLFVNEGIYFSVSGEASFFVFVVEVEVKTIKQFMGWGEKHPHAPPNIGKRGRQPCATTGKKWQLLKRTPSWCCKFD